MKLSKRARRGIRVFNQIQTGPSRFVYLLSQTKLAALKEKANGIIRAGREGNAEGQPPSTTDAVAPGEVQHDLHDGDVNDGGGTPDAEKIVAPIDPGIGHQVPDGNERGGHEK